MILRPGQDPFYVPTAADYPADAAWHGPQPPLLDPPQADWVSDLSRLKIALKGRQAGFSFAEMLAQVIDCADHPRTSWVNLSRGERQSKELIDKAALHVQTINAAIEIFAGQPIRENEFRYSENGIDKSVKLLEVVFKNGSIIRGLPANADTARGFAGNVFLDEFGFHPDGRAIKAGVVPIISRGYRLRLVSTPNGKSGPFYEMWSDLHGGYSKHRVDIYEMAARNVHYRPNVAELRAAMADDELFAQEYECAFLDEMAAFIPYDLISACESDDARIDTPLHDLTGDVFGGCDIGRRRDQTVVWLCERRPNGVLLTRQVTVLKNTPFARQLELIEPLAARCGRFAIDETGLGMMLAEELQRRHGARVLPVTFTMLAKEDLAVRAKRALEDRRFLIPAANFIRAAFHSIKRLPSGGEHFRFDSERGEETGHADAWWAACLCNQAATLPAIKFEYRSVVKRRLADWLGGDGKTRESLRPDPGRYNRPVDRSAGF
ncbi:terminase large subunit domain-containing protein [Zavarzinia sp.]|uniref:terminase large subunit domain-containing protein n=1 Tax=Zavarzinia sp. TaxID=2027920 RepID=UPI0035620FFF